jgi:hypothetical protein
MQVRNRWFVAGVVLVLALSAAGVVSAQEAVQAPKGPAVQGKVEAKAESSFTLTNAQGTVSVKVNAETRYQVPAVPEPTLADIQVGDAVLVLGRQEEGGAWLARMVKVLPPLPIYGLKGEVKALDGATITVGTPEGDKVLLTDENTRYRVPQVAEPTLADIEVGDLIMAIIEAKTDGTLLARSVAVLPEGTRGPVTLRGRVSAVAENGLRLKMEKGPVAVVVTAATHIWIPNDDTPTLNDIQVGDWVLVVGRRQGQARVEAIAIGLLPPVSAHRYVIPGEVLAIDGATLTVQDAKDAHSVFTDANTRFFVPGVEEPTLADIHVGYHIMAIGKPAEGAKPGEGRALQALVITVQPPKPTEVPAAVREPVEMPVF